MESSRERACPSCSAPAQSDQRWCLECGAELPEPSKRAGLRPAVGIATTLAVLVGAASAGGYTLMQDGKKPPPPATTVAQQPPPAATTPTVPPTTAPPSTDTPAPVTGRGAARLPDTSAGTGGGSTGGGGTTPPANDVPDLSGEVDTSTPNPPPPDDDAGEVDNGDGSVTDEPSGRDRRTTRPQKPRLVETNIALGAVAVVYPPATGGEDLGDAGAVVDGSTGTSWRTPTYDDPATNPQLGVYVDLASAERLTKLVVTSPTPGLRVEVYAARNGPPRSITAPGWAHLTDKTLAGRSTIELPAGADYRFVLLWVTGLPAGADHGAISEVQVFSKQPE